MGEKLQSMTGFASVSRDIGTLSVTCDVRSVNNKGLDIRTRAPAGLEALETPIKKRIAEDMARGSIQLFVTAAGGATAPAARIDEELFRALAQAGKQMADGCGIAPPTADGIMSLRGVVVGDEADNRLDAEAIGDDILDLVGEAVAALVAARQHEGAALNEILSGLIDRIETLVEKARNDPGSRLEAVQQRLRAQLDALLLDTGSIDPARLPAEAALLATKADIKEEVDRLDAHVAAARKLLAEGGAVGRKLDFLAQEFNREANTMCSKSATAELTAIGLDLKAAIDQFREQVQNLQ
ncbi:YicC/YloC family endoribonuclease [Oricola sp.]|uniref:YicC/YloC family endoribonuclease n=1 Tax=Oricola sp. TaxID=1979950 RepID=UPI003BADBB5B